MFKKIGSLQTFLANDDRQRTSAEIVKDVKLYMSTKDDAKIRRKSARSINSARRPMTSNVEDSTLMVSMGAVRQAGHTKVITENEDCDPNTSRVSSARYSVDGYHIHLERNLTHTALDASDHSSYLDSGHFSRMSPLESSSDEALYCQNSNIDIDALLDDYETYLAKPAAISKSVLEKMLLNMLSIENVEVSTKIIAIIVSLNVQGSNLRDILRMTYDLTRKFPTAPCFANRTFLRSLCSLADQQSILFDGDSLMYLFGSLDFLTLKDANSTVLDGLIELEYIQSCGRCMNMIAYQISLDREDANYVKALGHLISSMTNVIRRSMKASQQDSLLPQLTLEIGYQFRSNSKITFQIFRLLSELTIHDGSNASIIDLETQEKIVGFCINSLENYSGNTDVVVRILFVLGNLLGSSVEAPMIAYRFPNSMKILTGIMQIVHNVESSSSNNGAAGLELAWNLVRVIANLSVDPLVGSALCTVDNLLEQQICILERFPKNSEDEAYIELVINVLISLHNLTFHLDDYTALEDLAIRLAAALREILLQCSMASPVFLEGLSLLSNLTKYEEVAQWMTGEYRLLRLIIDLMTDQSRELISSAIGVLINVTFCASDFQVAKMIDRAANGIRLNCEILDLEVCSLYIKLFMNLMQDLKEKSNFVKHFEMVVDCLLKVTDSLLVNHGEYSHTENEFLYLSFNLLDVITT